MSNSLIPGTALSCCLCVILAFPVAARQPVSSLPRLLAQTLQRPTLTLGSQGTEVYELQAALKLLGYYPGQVDGVFSEPTAQAVIQFQQIAGLEPDGIVGVSTWNRLFPSASLTASPVNPTPNPPVLPPAVPTPSPTLLRRGMQGDAVARLQDRLQALGFYQGEIDGDFGEATEAAVMSAQSYYGLEPDGIVGAATWAALER